MSGIDFSFTKIWNDSLLTRKERPIEPRTHIWASEIGGSFANRYYKMMGVKPTNPPNNRSLRKFASGTVWEFVVYSVLLHSGIIIGTQDRIEHQYPNLLNVTGKQDFLIGGVPDLERAEREILNQNYPEMILHTSLAIIEKLRGMNAMELKKTILEIKSSASTMFSVYERTNRAADNHYSQIFHYLIGNKMGITDGKIVYINKDDCMLLEFDVKRSDAAIEAAYKADIEQMTYYINNKEVPPKEEEVMFKKDTLSFAMNWKVEYSDYLTMLYGYTIPEDYRNKWQKPVASWNRTYKRVIKGERMTALNLKTIEEIKVYFPNFDDLCDIGKMNKQFIEEQEEVEE